MGLGLRICIYSIGSQDFDLWVWVCEFRYLGLGLRIWITVFGSLGLVLRI